MMVNIGPLGCYGDQQYTKRICVHSNTIMHRITFSIIEQKNFVCFSEIYIEKVS